MPEALITPNVLRWARERAQFTPEFVDVYHDLLRKQEWFREYRLQEGAEKQ